MRPRWKLPPPRDLGWRLRRVEDAETSLEVLADGRRELRIRHQVLTGITLPMLAWWFQRFDQPCEHRGVRYAQMYLLWHPFDHHSVAITRDADGRVAPGQTIHIREAFARDLRHAVDQRVTIHRWDEDGVGFHARRLGREMFRLDHSFRPVDGGVRYDSRMVLGHAGGLLRPLVNRVALPREFSDAKARAWLAHNVEEVGCFLDFLPELYGRAGAAASS